MDKLMAAIAALIVAVMSFCGTDSTTTDPPTTPASTPTAAPRAGAMTVTVQDSPGTIPAYKKSVWGRWKDLDGDCQDTRQEVLIRDSRTSAGLDEATGCKVVSGEWVGPYSGVKITAPGSIDIDHVVPLKNAWNAGAHTWTRTKQQQYYNSLAYDGHLRATTASSNRSKGSKGPEWWKPAQDSFHCQYAVDWVTIKKSWSLTVTTAEADALETMLGTCEPAVSLVRVEA